MYSNQINPSPCPSVSRIYEMLLEQAWPHQLCQECVPKTFFLESSPLLTWCDKDEPETVGQTLMVLAYLGLCILHSYCPRYWLCTSKSWSWCIYLSFSRAFATGCLENGNNGGSSYKSPFSQANFSSLIFCSPRRHQCDTHHAKRMHFHGFFCQQVSTEFQDISRKEELFALSFVIARECYLGLYCRTNKAKREQLNKIFILQRRSNSKKRSHSLFWSEREKEEKLGPIAARIIIISNPPKTDTFLPTARAVSLLHSKHNGSTLLHIKQETTLMETLAPSGLAFCHFIIAIEL